MIGLLQRVSEASVVIDGELVAAIERGLLVLVAVQREDSEQHAQRLIERLLGYRVFPDADGKMNLNVRDVSGGLLLVPQFTLAADTRKGTRASFAKAAAPEIGKQLFEFLVERASSQYHSVAAGRFGADMAVSLTNDGPVTFWLETAAN